MRTKTGNMLVMKTNLFIILLLTSTLAFGKSAEVLLQDIFQAPVGMMRLIKGQGAPILFIDGLEPTEANEEMRGPIEEFITLRKNVYYHKWSKFESLKKNQELFVISIKSLLAQYKRMKLTVISYSAGGAVAMLAKDQMMGDPLNKRVHLHTISAPLFGYGAPKISLVANPFVGDSTMQVGIGAHKKLKNARLSQCSHWVTGNCELDSHACLNKRKKLYPQTGPADGSIEMPCGNENTHVFYDEDHKSIIIRAIQKMNF